MHIAVIASLPVPSAPLKLRHYGHIMALYKCFIIIIIIKERDGNYLGKQDALRLEIYWQSLALAIEEVLQSDEPDATHLTHVPPRHCDHQLTRLTDRQTDRQTT